VALASPGTSTGPGAPVRRTFLGLERQGLGWTLAIAAIALLFAVGLPLADSAVSTDGPAAAGSVADAGLGVHITPVPGWSVVPQPGGGGNRIQFTRAGALVTAEATPYSGSTDAAYVRLATEIEAGAGVQIAADPATITTTSGLVGIASAFASSTEQGYFAVFSARGVLAVVIADSPLAVFPLVDGDMIAMIRSVSIGSAP
jgi:hypothetical protein